MTELTQEQLEALAHSDDAQEMAELARHLLAARQRIDALEKQLAVSIHLPFCNASPVCEIEAGYAAGVSDCKEAIRRAGYPIWGDD